MPLLHLLPEMNRERFSKMTTEMAPFSVRIKPELRKAVREYCRRNRMTVQIFTTLAIREALKKGTK